jgi:hypothetical protein
VRRLSLLVFAPAVLTCCSGRQQKTEQPSDSASIHSAGSRMSDQTAEDSANAVMRGFLEAALYSHEGAVPDSLAACNEDYAPPNKLALASFNLLGSRAVGDSVQAAAMVVSVARFLPGAHNTDRAELGVRVDTLHWRLIRHARTRRWVVCGYSLEGYDFATFVEDPTVRWSPSGASARAAKRLADSIATSAL